MHQLIHQESGLEETIKGITPSWKGTIDTSFSKQYTFLGWTFENLTAYASKSTLAAIRKTSDLNDTSMAIRFTANGHSVVSLGNLQIQLVTVDAKFQKKVKKKYDVMLAVHHGSGNSATYAVGKNAGPITHTLLSGTSYIQGRRNDWDKYSGTHKMIPAIQAKDLKTYWKNSRISKFYLTVPTELSGATSVGSIFGENINSSYKWSSLTNEVTKEENTIINSGAR